MSAAATVVAIRTSTAIDGTTWAITPSVVRPSMSSSVRRSHTASPPDSKMIGVATSRRLWRHAMYPA